MEGYRYEAGLPLFVRMLRAVPFANAITAADAEPINGWYWFNQSVTVPTASAQEFVTPLHLAVTRMRQHCMNNSRVLADWICRMKTLRQVRLFLMDVSHTEQRSRTEWPRGRGSSPILGMILLLSGSGPSGFLCSITGGNTAGALS
jgi:hypothetical protein